LGVAAALTVAVAVATPPSADVGFLWRAARALAGGGNPYDTGEGAYPFLYPLPAAVLFLPFAWLPELAATKVATALSAGVMAYLLPAHRWPALLSVPFWLGVRVANPWAMLALAGLGWITAAKPNIGGVALIANPRRRDLGVAMGLTAIAFVLMPTWPLHWLASLSRQIAPHWPPLMWPLGVVGLGALLRWRTSEGRALAAITLLPSSALPYDLLTLHLCARSPRDSWVLTACGWATFLVLTLTAPHDLVRPWTWGHAIMALGLLAPCAVIILRHPR
jgi:hypothetical protein